MWQSGALEEEKLNNSYLHKVNTRVKLLTAFTFAVTVMALKTVTLLTLACSLSIVALLLAGVTARQVLVRLMHILPFLIPVILIILITTPGHEIMKMGVFAISVEGIKHSIIIMLRIISEVFAFTAVINTIVSKHILTTLLQLRIPCIFIHVVEFALRYIDVLAQETKAMFIARRSRGYQKSRFFTLKDLQEMGSLIGMLFIRSYARTEKLYIAMLSRGYTVETVSNTDTLLKPADIAVSTGIFLASMFMVLVDRGGINLWI